MKYPIDFAKLQATIDAAWHTAYMLTYYVQHYPDQVTACCCLFLAGARFVTWVRRKR